MGTGPLKKTRVLSPFFQDLLAYLKQELPMKPFGLLLSAVVVLTGLIGSASGQDKNPVVVMDTSLGKVAIELFADKAPITVKNFLQYADDKHYDGTIFHRIIADFMVQGGGMEPG